MGALLSVRVQSISVFVQAMDFTERKLMNKYGLRGKINAKIDLLEMNPVM